MSKIYDLLNPSGPSEPSKSGMAASSSTFAPPLTPALTSTASTASYSPRMDTQASSPAKRQKLVKDAPVFVKGEVRSKVHYPPYESNEDAISLSPRDRDDLQLQHRRFKIYPSGTENTGLISDFTRRIPYSSEKKEFFGRTGWGGFDVFQYTFKVPTDPEKEHTVMWDYNTGLVRITPFFKACKYPKTTPAKALNANPGLKEMSHSITGGALVAQGYWMPYACARAICVTFAYDIRWALTPIFGPSFIRECLSRDHPGFARFKIASETIRCAKLDTQGRMGMPNSVPEPQEHHSDIVGNQQRVVKPTFKLGSPFDSESEASTASGYYGLAGMPSALNSPAISPKNTTFDASGWTSINQSAANNNINSYGSAPPSPPPNTSHNSFDSSLLTEPSYASWRPAQPVGAGFASTTNNINTTGTKPVKRVRRNSGAEDDYSSSAATSNSSNSSSSQSDDMEIDAYPQHTDINNSPKVYSTLKRIPTVTHTGRLPLPRFGNPYAVASSSQESTPPLKKSKKYTAEDFRAARLLLEMSQDDNAGGRRLEFGVFWGEGKGKGKGKKW